VPPANSLKPSIVAYLVKPFARDVVVDAVSRAVEWHAAAVARGPDPAAADVMATWFESMKE
jgi:hypothetical protein